MADPVLEAALGQSVVWLFGAIRIDLDGIGSMTGPLCLLDGAGEIVISAETYTGGHDLYGTIDSIDVITESDGDQAPEIRLTLNVPNATGAAQLASPAMQGREVQIMVGAVDPSTGLIIGTPEVKFLGEIDVPTLVSGENSRTLDLTIVSVFERLFEVEDGARLQDGWHQSIWPGEKGFEYMTGTDKNLYWASQPPPQTGLVSRLYRGGGISQAAMAYALSGRRPGA